MDKKDRLLFRLDEIGSALQRSGNALALIGLGSVGLELERLDEFSDLDFFVIVEEDCKATYLENLTWLAAACPVAYVFRNTLDGYKLLFEDGIFCEFAVFELKELERIPFAPGRVVWKQPHVPESIAEPQVHLEPQEARTQEWLVGEIPNNSF